MPKKYDVVFSEKEIEEVSRALVGHLHDLSISHSGVQRYRDLVPMPEHVEAFDITKRVYEKMLNIRFGGIING